MGKRIDAFQKKKCNCEISIQKSLTSLAIKEIQIKPSHNSVLPQLEWLSRIQKIINAGKDAGKKNPSACWNVN